MKHPFLYFLLAEVGATTSCIFIIRYATQVNQFVNVGLFKSRVDDYIIYSECIFCTEKSVGFSVCRRAKGGKKYGKKGGNLGGVFPISFVLQNW